MSFHVHIVEVSYVVTDIDVIWPDKTHKRWNGGPHGVDEFITIGNDAYAKQTAVSDGSWKKTATVNFEAPYELNQITSAIQSVSANSKTMTQTAPIGRDPKPCRAYVNASNTVTVCIAADGLPVSLYLPDHSFVSFSSFNAVAPIKPPF